MESESQVGLQGDDAGGPLLRTNSNLPTPRNFMERYDETMIDDPFDDVR